MSCTVWKGCSLPNGRLANVPSIVPVVEGPGDREAAPVLLRKVLAERLTRHDITIKRPKSANGKPRLVRDLERFLRYAVVERDCGAILVLLDADDECPKQEVARLAKRAAALGLQVPVAIVYAKHEYETWFIASLDSPSGEQIRNRLVLPAATSFTGDVEEKSGAKSWLTHHMPAAKAYKPTTDQAALSQFIHLDHTHDRSRSFRRLCHAVEELVAAIDDVTSPVMPAYAG